MTTAAKPAPFGPDLRSALVAMVRKRVPESEVEDIVQSALTEAIESPHAPTDSESLRRWIFGVAKNKVVDYHRRAGRESFDLPEVAGAPAPHVEADFLRWAERNLPQGVENQKTLDWMLREGEGEKLESIAESEKLPPPRVRQRVSRLRRHFKENWQREIALLASLGVIIGGVLLFLRYREKPPIITHEDPRVDPRVEEAQPVRRLALEKCAAADWRSCIEGLDEAKRLDPAGDTRPDVQRARQDAANQPAPTPTLAPSVTPSAAPLPTIAPPLSSGGYRGTPSPQSTEPPLQKPAPSKMRATKPASSSSLNDKGSDDLDGFGSAVSGLGTSTAPSPKKAAFSKK